MSIFSGEGRTFDDAGVRYPAGIDTGPRGAVAYHMTSGAYEVGRIVAA